MTAMMEMPRVQECTVHGCSYNHNGCRAFAITVGSMNHAHCDTFVETPNKGGIESIVAQVGACKRDDCQFNIGLECRAPAITVAAGQDMADCMTYQPAMIK